MSLILYDGLYTPELLREHPDLKFVFGDNLIRVGKGGQAIIRDEPNALGIATKRSPGEYMVEGSANDMSELAHDMRKAEFWIRRQGVVIPVTKDGDINIGTGLAALPTRAPTLYAMLQTWLKAMKNDPNLYSPA